MDDDEGDFPITREARKRRAQQIARFNERQRRRRDWISFADIADWFSCESGSIRPDETRRAHALDALERDFLAGYFEANGRSRVLFLPADMREARLTRDELREVIKYNLDGSEGRSQYLLNCWLPRTMVERFFARHRLGDLPTHWVSDRGQLTTMDGPPGSLRLSPQRASEGDPQTVDIETREAPPATPTSARKPRMSDSDMEMKLPPFLKALEVEHQRERRPFNQDTAREAAEDHFQKFIDRERFRVAYRNAGLNQSGGRRRGIPPKS